jgi:hypothetical protein
LPARKLISAFGEKDSVGVTLARINIAFWKPGGALVRAMAFLTSLCFSLVFLLAGQSHRQQQEPAKAPLLTLTGGGSTSVGQTSVDYKRSTRGLALVIWWDSAGASESASESGPFGSNAWRAFTPAKGKKITWEWKGAREKGGDFKLNGKPYDLAKGMLLLVSTKGGDIRVTQLDVDLSKVEPNGKGLQGLAKKHETLAKFSADASDQK